MQSSLCHGRHTSLHSVARSASRPDTKPCQAAAAGTVASNAMHRAGQPICIEPNSFASFVRSGCRRGCRPSQCLFYSAWRVRLCCGVLAFVCLGVLVLLRDVRASCGRRGSTCSQRTAPPQQWRSHVRQNAAQPAAFGSTACSACTTRDHTSIPARGARCHRCLRSRRCRCAAVAAWPFDSADSTDIRHH